MTKPTLGRGLASLIPPRETELEKFKKTVESEKVKESVFSIEIEKIKANPQQPRSDFDGEGLAELANSIREYGILQPLVAAKIETESPIGMRVEYQLIAGERRLRAAKLAGLKQVPVIVRTSAGERQKLELALIENIQRRDLNPIEKALAFQRLMKEFGFSQKEVADKIGKSREAIANLVRLLGLPIEIQKALREAKISEGHARAILAVENSQKQVAFLDEILKNNLSVRQSEESSRQLVSVRSGSPHGRPKDPEVRALESRLEEILGTKVNINKRGEKGKIIIGFYSQDELNGIIDKIMEA